MQVAGKRNAYAVTTFPLWFTTIECNCLVGKLTVYMRSE